MSDSSNHFDCAVCGLTNKDFKYYGIGECNHPICGICAIKLAKFSKDSENLYDYSKCVICKQKISKIVISAKIDIFDSFNDKNMTSVEQYGLLFESPGAKKFYEDVVRIKCKKCKVEFNSIEELVDHVEIHRFRYCSLCVEFNKCLPSEFAMMTDNDFHYHNTKTHPKCDFCTKRYYDNTHLIKHVKESHFLCDICHRRHGFVAYNTQNELLKHFVNDHHVCEICRSIGNINVFDTEYNLKTHKVLEHDNKGLVSEGLVNINYGDANTRYGARRRPRDNEEPIFDEATAPLNQQLPEMACEQEFPPLNSDVAPPNRQLGVRSTTNDDNDARGAFVPRSGQCEEPKKVAPMANVKEAMSANVAYSNKKSIGRLNDNDFPSLSAEVKVKDNQKLEYNRFSNVQSNRDSGATKKKPSNEEDFPALSGRTGQANVAPQWKTSVKTKQTSQAPKTMATKHVPAKQVHSAPRVREPSPDRAPEVDMELERELAYQPKIQYVNEEEFRQSNQTIKTTIGSRGAPPPPQDGDFPALGGARRNGGDSSTKTVVGAWGEYNVATSKPRPKIEKVALVPDSFSSNGPLDFPELPFKEKPTVTNGHSKQKNKNKQQPHQHKTNNFLEAASSGSQCGVYSMRSSEVKEVKEVKESRDTSGYYDSGDNVYSHRPVISSAMRGIDYVPHVVPTNENVVFVDSKKFRDLKNPRQTESVAAERSMGGDYEAEFPGVSGATGHGGFNHFSVLEESCVSSDIVMQRPQKPKEVKVAPPVAPALSSNKDFPSLGGDRAVVAKTKAPRTNGGAKSAKHKASGKEAPVATVVAPVPMSLADVALTVTNKAYTPFMDADSRNQAMLETVHDVLDQEQAQRFLSLASQYRGRRTTAPEYLAAVNGAFPEHMDLVSCLLPQMLVLLPDISLQKALMVHLGHDSTSGLRECLKCGQIMDRGDAGAHDLAAHDTTRD